MIQPKQPTVGDRRGRLTKTPCRAVSFWLEQHHVDYLVKVGDGNVSHGLRKVLDKVLTSAPE